MLTKAILTGGVLALLSGSIVYFGTEGADALERDVSEDTRLDETELAGAADSESEIVKTVEGQIEEATVKEKRAKKPRIKNKDVDTDAAGEEVQTAAVDPIDPPAEKTEAKPKTKWLDQYLKSSKSKKDAETASDPKAEETRDKDLEEEKPVEAKSLVIDAHEDGSFRYSDGTIVEDEADLKHAREALDAIAGAEDSDGGEKPVKREKIRKKIVVKMEGDDLKTWASDGENIDIDMEMIEDLMREHAGSDKDVRVLRLDRKSSKAKKSDGKRSKGISYDLVLDEARKLQVVDMRNIAMFEIIDYAIDRKDFGQAADILTELTEPELRDTARAKIGVGLAKAGDSEAAFAVLDEMEIDELTASMRLEIITALVATKAERNASGLRR